MCSKLKAAVIGFWGHPVFAISLAANPCVELAAVCDWRRETERTEEVKTFCQENNSRYFDSIDELCAFGNYDLIAVLAPGGAMPEIIEKIAGKTKGVLLEKPVARDIAGVRKIADIIRRNNLKMSIAYPMRFTSHLECCRAAIQRGDIGKPLTGEYTYLATNGPLYTCNTSEENLKLIAGGCDTMFLGYGVLDLEWLAGSRIKEVFARGGAFFYDNYRQAGINDLTMLSFTMENNFKGSITVGRITAQNRNAVHMFDVSGELGSVSADYSRDKIALYNSGFKQRPLFEPTCALLANDLVNAVASGGETRFTVEDLFQTIAVQEAVKESILTGQPVAVARM